MTSENHLEAIARMIARVIAEQSETETTDSVLNWAYQVEDINAVSRAKPVRKNKTPNDIVDAIYGIYPSTDPINNNRPVRTGTKDRDKIRKLLESGQETPETLSAKIRFELDVRRKSNSYLRNLSTVLNDLPDMEDNVFTPTPKAKSKYR